MFSGPLSTVGIGLLFLISVCFEPALVSDGAAAHTSAKKK